MFFIINFVKLLTRLGGTVESSYTHAHTHTSRAHCILHAKYTQPTRCKDRAHGAVDGSGHAAVCLERHQLDDLDLCSRADAPLAGFDGSTALCAAPKKEFPIWQASNAAIF